MTTFPCPKGHDSTEADYCSDCGVKIGGATVASAPAAGDAAAVTCPDCSTPHSADSGKFCEICGYNFATGARGQLPVAPPPAMPPRVAPPDPMVFDRPEVIGNPPDMPPPPMPMVAPPDPIGSPLDLPPPPLPPDPATAVPPTATPTWELVIRVDSSLRQADSPEAPGIADRAIPLTQPQYLIGRTSDARAIFPEIALDEDAAVSHRHGLVARQADGSYVLRDLGSSNGTVLNGVEMKSLVDCPLRPGDEFTLGHWTRIQVVSR
jgi:FHA domain